MVKRMHAAWFWLLLGAALSSESAMAQGPTLACDSSLMEEPHLDLGWPCGGSGGFGERTRKPDDPPDLTLWNFFTAGWDDEYTRRDSEDRAPDFALLHVQTNFMEREFRVDSYYQTNVNSKKTDNIYFLDYLFAYSWNRRLQFNV